MRTITRARAAAISAVVALLAILTPAQATAQNAVITGRVTSEFSQPVEGANVYINSMAISVATNAQGQYTITIPPARATGAQVNIRVRAIGYQPDTRPIRVTPGSQEVNFTLRQDVNRLDEIVVTGVVEGVERAKVPFSVARLTTTDMPVPALDPLRSLTGKVAGVRIGQVSGRPGETPAILMRGPTSINAAGRELSPLIIVDDVIMNVGSLEELGALDIESVEVVKGAAGASLYGTRAANGVITIRTKRGSGEEGIQFNVRQEYGFSDLNSLEYGIPVNHHLQLDETGQRFCVAGSGTTTSCSRTYDWMTEIMRINSVPGDTLRRPQTQQFAAPSGEDIRNVYQANIWPGRYYNTLAQVTTRNPTNITSVDASGRVSNVRYYVSGSYQHEQGALKLLNGYQARRGRVNLDYNARQDLVVSVSSMYAESSQDLRNPGQGFGGLLRGAPPGTDYLAVDSLGRGIFRGGGSPLRGTGNGGTAFLYDVDGNRFNTRTSDRYLANVSARYFPADWVTLEGNFAYDNRSRFDEEIVTKGYRSNTLSPNTNGGNMDVENRNDNSMTASLTSTFRRQLTPDLNGKLQFRGLYDEQSRYTNGVEGDVFLVKDIHTLDNLSSNFDPNSSLESTINVGFFAATSLDYKDKYIFDGTFRYDGSSRFGAGNRWAPFSRVSAVWRVSEEDFWNLGYVSDFRVRASRGTAGSTPRFSAQYETYDVATDGIALGQAGNSKLKPETTTEYEVGSDFTIFDRLGVEFTYAHATTQDQILNVSTPASLGFTSQWQNAGTLLNKTFELGLNLPVLNTRDFSWSMRGTWDRTRTYITELFAPEYVTSAGTTQGTGSMFFITANDSVINGFQMNRYGNIWGRRFYQSCGEMPSALQTFCGEGQHFQVNDDGWVVWVGQGNSWRDGITRNLWQTQLPSCNLTGAARTPDACLAAGRSPFGSANLWFGHPVLDRPLAGQSGEGSGIQQPIGNVFPDFRFTWGNTMQYKRLSFYALFDGTMGHDIYNQGEGWGLLDYNSSYFDMANRTVETAKPVGYGWRVGAGEGAGTGGFYDLLGPNSYVVEDGSYVKVRELSAMYKVGPVRGVGDWTLGIVGRNMFTFTNYTGYDPETGATGGTNEAGSGLINQVDAFGFPTLRTFTFTLTSRF